MPEHWDEDYIAGLQVDTRVGNALRNAGVKGEADLLALRERALAAMPNVGRKTVNAVLALQEERAPLTTRQRGRKTRLRWHDPGAAPGDYWRSAAQIRGHLANIKSAVACDRTGSEITLDLSTAHALIEIALQAMHTELGHGN